MSIQAELLGAPRVPLRYLVRFNPRPTATNSDDSCYLPMEAISEFGAVDSSRMRPTSELAQGYSFVADGDVAYAKVTPCFENGKGLRAAGLPGGHAFATTEITVMRPSSQLDSRYLAWILQSEEFRAPGEAHMSGAGGLKRVPESYAARFRVPHPGTDVQRAIADYLDQETAQIDAFIAKNEELITLLTERRGAVIADAVTGGVGQEARLVDSGVDWIGSIPANWDVRPLRWSARIRTGTTPSGDMVFADEPGEPWIRPDDLDVSGAASVASRWLTPEGAAQGRPAVPGATLVCTIGATLGKSGRIEGISYFNQQITSVSWKLNDELLYWIFVAAREAVARLSVGNTLPILNNDKLATLRIPVPPMEEQGVIVDYIRAQTTRIDAAIQTAHRGVELARERRAALISAAVTGKIDVGVAV